MYYYNQPIFHRRTMRTGLSGDVGDSNQGILAPKRTSKTFPPTQELRFPGCLHCVLIHLNPVVNPPVLSAFGGNNSLFGMDNSNPL